MHMLWEAMPNFSGIVLESPTGLNSLIQSFKYSQSVKDFVLWLFAKQVAIRKYKVACRTEVVCVKYCIKMCMVSTKMLLHCF